MPCRELLHPQTGLWSKSSLPHKQEIVSHKILLTRTSTKDRKFRALQRTQLIRGETPTSQSTPSRSTKSNERPLKKLLQLKWMTLARWPQLAELKTLIKMKTAKLQAAPPLQHWTTITGLMSLRAPRNQRSRRSKCLKLRLKGPLLTAKIFSTAREA